MSQRFSIARAAAPLMVSLGETGRRPYLLGYRFALDRRAAEEALRHVRDTTL
jgi:hypothetical protein